MRMLRDSFLKLASNPKPLSQLLNNKDLVNVYLTQDSIVKNFNNVFGYRNETLAMRFYNYMADGYKGVHIFIPTFVIKLQGLIEGGTLQINLFSFNILDSELKGNIHASDIADIIKNGLAFCPEIAVGSGEEYAKVDGFLLERSKSDRRCRCALY